MFTALLLALAQAPTQPVTDVQALRPVLRVSARQGHGGVKRRHVIEDLARRVPPEQRESLIPNLLARSSWS